LAHARIGVREDFAMIPKQRKNIAQDRPRSSWIPHLYRFTFLAQSIGCFILGFEHVIASLALFTLAVMSLVVSGDLSIDKAISLIRAAKSGKSR
jgi:hypothetical protein